MELVYLVCSLLSTSITSFLLSLLLPFRLLLRPLFGGGADDDAVVSLYEGTVWHERLRPVHHSFQYPVRYALIDLDHASNPPSDHLSAHQARLISGTTGPVSFLLTIPPSVGYVQNPLSLYYCYDIEGSSQTLKKCIAEVTNTPWGERVSFLFNPNSDVVAKALHVSPFMDMLGTWTMKTNIPGDNLFVTISVNHPKHGDYFSASLMAKRVSSSMHTDLALFFWLMPHKVAFWIYWQALKLWWKGVPFLQHPRYYNPRYRGEAVLSDENLQCCPVFVFETQNNQSAVAAHSTSKHHCFTWRDAKWPWC
ncbi:uncharacterized protein LOC132609577 isoform X1 [Lycium barbarum]|uniref:uncharacterized protein LOC132609577 isoform X1 n=1 Tax=Lycium barbarum TaxID=112863 RepID=UPI00293EB4BB|nr:uncharacterized protein LOC132609577 isoform X1 [Lycium barbarum]XP_060179609.1 uncharacterized protein LOC132609577 isoform X1 [Lycium barbarum]XP_060179610.1 uncharacterized protein LOC132609577 isoform X1 [Lycium barbarum]